MTNEEHAALIADCKAEIKRLEWISEHGTATPSLLSNLKRQQIALASLESNPTYMRLFGHYGCGDSCWVECGLSEEGAQRFYPAPPVVMMHPDELRMDWLCAHSVEVRKPLMYGSHAMFHAQQDSEEWDLPHHTTLREQIDEAIRAAGGSVKE